MQLAFSDTDRTTASDERLADLLSASSASLALDPVRSLFYANEALLLAESLDRAYAELQALKAVIAAMHADRRTSDSAPYIARAIELAERIADGEALDDMVRMLGNWAIEVERTPSGNKAGLRRKPEPALPLLLNSIARLEQARERLTEQQPMSEPPAESLLVRRPDLGIEDPETGLLNARGMTVELLRIEDSQTNLALIQVAINEPDRIHFMDLGRIVSDLVADEGLVARNSDLTLTAILPGITGIRAMTLAENLRSVISRRFSDAPFAVGIGVSIKQPGETSRDVLRRVVDRREEALLSSSVTVVG